MRVYKALKRQEFNIGDYCLTPIRYEDRFKIMQWRNEQIYHLRQSEPLTIENQETYFNTTITSLFKEENPNQILFSFLKSDECIGYGGLVHINWVDKNAEISFIMDTLLEATAFHEIWKSYISLIEKVGFEDLGLHKLYTYAFDLRPQLYKVLESMNYKLDAKLNQHCFFNGEYIDVLIHYKTTKK